MKTSRDWELVLSAHELRLAKLELIPATDRGCEVLGSIEYHRDSIRIINLFRAENFPSEIRRKQRELDNT